MQGAFAGVTSRERAVTAPLLLFTLLMLLHAALHWFSFSHLKRCRYVWSSAYFIVQGALILGISFLARGDWLLILGLYVALIGRAFVLLQPVYHVLPVIIGCVALFGLGMRFQQDWTWTSLHVSLFLVFPMILFVIGYSQMHAREQAQALLLELEDAHAQVLDYAEQVEELTLTAERERLARDLHDTLAQGLTGLVITLEVVDSHLAHNHIKRARELVQETMVAARATLAEARAAIDDLRASTTHPDHFSLAVQEAIRRFTLASGICCHANLASLVLVPDSQGEHILRMITESLANVIRHAQASQVWVSLAQCDSSRIIEVRDDGIGFDPLAMAQQDGHYGLLGLRERARMNGGELEVRSALGQGTTLRLHLPVEKDGKRDG
ncbi:MAG: sensor histidine kinase [Chloroflexota bacterium]|nr:sensor histidine kinase [Chloroflexota bacterium]